MSDLPWQIYANAGRSIGAGIEGIAEGYQARERKRVLSDLLGNIDPTTTEGALAVSKALLQKGFTKEGMTLVELAMGNRRELQKQANEDRQFQFQRENATAGRDLQRQTLDLQRRAFEQKPPGQVTEIFTPDGRKAKALLNPDGSYKVIGGASVADAKALSEGAIKQLREAGTSLSDADRFGSGFKDEFAGWRNQRLGETANLLARTTGIGNEQAASWWQDYDRYKNQVRNQLFGSALTVAEAAAFEKADINPGMTPQAIRSNLAAQRRAAESAAKKVAGVYAAQGRSTDEIEAALGMPIEVLGIKPKVKAAPASAPAPANPANAPVSSAARVLGPAPAGATEGRTGNYQGVRFIVRNGQMVTIE